MHVHRDIRHMFVTWYFINLFLMINYECKHYSSFRRYKSKSVMMSLQLVITGVNESCDFCPRFIFASSSYISEKNGTHLVLY